MPGCLRGDANRTRLLWSLASCLLLSRRLIIDNVGLALARFQEHSGIKMHGALFLHVLAGTSIHTSSRGGVSCACRQDASHGLLNSPFP